MLKVYTNEALLSERKEKAKTVTAHIFEGDRKMVKDSVSRPYLTVTTQKTKEQNLAELEEMRGELSKRIENAAQPPSAAELEAFFGKFFIEVTRQAMESPDLTSLIANEVTNFEFPSIVYLRDVKKFRGKMGLVQGTNDPVNLIEQNTGNNNTVEIYIKALGWKDSLMNLLFNKFFTMDKVVQAAVDAYIDERNTATAGVMIGATYVASQQQAAVATAGLTLDEKTYETMLAGNKLVRSLKDPQTGKKIAVPSLSVLCNSADTWQIENVIRGQLNGDGSTARVSNRPGLPIGQVIEYDGGINNGITIGKETISIPGVTAGKCYLFVPKVLDVLVKRPLTMETGRGSVLSLSTEERAWYMAQGEYTKDLLGSSYPGTALGAGYGAVIEITLPS
jgi:hypothetical protein